MTKYQEDELYDIKVELIKNPQMEEIFQKKFDKVQSKEKYKYMTFFEKYRIAYQKTVKKMNKIELV